MHVENNQIWALALQPSIVSSKEALPMRGYFRSPFLQVNSPNSGTIYQTGTQNYIKNFSLCLAPRRSIPFPPENPSSWCRFLCRRTSQSNWVPPRSRRFLCSLIRLGRRSLLHPYPARGEPLQSLRLYKVIYLVVHLGGFDLDFHCSTVCSILLGPTWFWQKGLSNWARRWNIQPSQSNWGAKPGAL